MNSSCRACAWCSEEAAPGGEARQVHAEIGQAEQVAQHPLLRARRSSRRGRPGSWWRGPAAGPPRRAARSGVRSWRVLRQRLPQPDALALRRVGQPAEFDIALPLVEAGRLEVEGVDIGRMATAFARPRLGRGDDPGAEAEPAQPLLEPEIPEEEPAGIGLALQAADDTTLVAQEDGKRRPRAGGRASAASLKASRPSGRTSISASAGVSSMLSVSPGGSSMGAA